MKSLFLIVFALTFIEILYSQEGQKDFLITNKNDTLYCKFVKFKGMKIKFLDLKTNKIQSENIYKYSDIRISNPDIFHNPLGLNISAPEPGYSFVYLYRPYMYYGSLVTFKVGLNQKDFFFLKVNGCCCAKLKAGETYELSLARNRSIQIKPEDGMVYFIRVSSVSFKSLFSNDKCDGFGKSLVIDKPEIARHVILTMKRKCKSSISTGE